jgi:glycosyltransferase involved in cell wall biosynthesis
VPKLSVTVITKNEAADLADALRSVQWADEIVVVDAESTDGTAEVARQFTDRVIVRAWPGYVGQKNYAASMASNDWILSLDADERVTPALAAEIRAALSSSPAHAAFRMRRVTWHLGRWIRSTDWYPDYQVRLFDRRAAHWTGEYVHEAIAADGSVGELRGELQHFAYRDVADHLETIDRYTTFAARQMHEAGRRAGLLHLAVHPPLAFLRNYVVRGGFRQRIPGFIVSVMNAYYVFLKFAKLWELSRAAHTPHAAPGTRHEAPSTQHPGRTQHPATGTQHPAPSTQHPAPSTPERTQHPAPSTRHLT